MTYDKTVAEEAHRIAGHVARVRSTAAAMASGPTTLIEAEQALLDRTFTVGRDEALRYLRGHRP